MDVYGDLVDAFEIMDRGGLPNIAPILGDNVSIAELAPTDTSPLRLVAVDGASIYMESLRRPSPVIPYGISPQQNGKKELLPIPLIVLPEVDKLLDRNGVERSIVDQTVAQVISLCANFQNGLFFTAEGKHVLASFSFLKPLVNVVFKEIANAARFEMMFAAQSPALDPQEKLFLEAYVATKKDAIASIDIGEVEVYGAKYFVVAVNFKPEMEKRIEEAAAIKNEVQNLIFSTHNQLLMLHEFGEPMCMGSGIVRIDPGIGLDGFGLPIIGQS